MIEKIESGDRPITYSRVSLSRSPRGLSEIFRDNVPRHIRSAELRKIRSNDNISQMNIKLTPKVREYLFAEKRINSSSSFPQCFVTCC